MGIFVRRILRHVKFSLLALLLIEAGSAGAATMSILEHSSYVRLYGRIDSFNNQSQQHASAVYDKELHGDETFEGMLKLGMSIELSDGNGYGQGQVSQTLVAQDNHFTYGGLADVNISGYSSYPSQVEGYGAAIIQTSIHFRLSERNEVKVFLESFVGEYMDEDFKLVLSKGGNAIWSRVGGSEPDQRSRAASEILLLDSGDYVMNVSLKAASYLSSGNSLAGRSWSNFSVSAVPELPPLQQGIVGVLSIMLTASYLRLRKREPMQG